MPINNFIAVTEPLGAERAAAIVRNGYAVADSRFVVNYYRMTVDHRLLFGGGENYSYRFPKDIGALLQLARRWFELSPGYEFSVEANPSGLEQEKLAALAAHGVNRISLGVQSFDAGVLAVEEGALPGP